MAAIVIVACFALLLTFALTYYPYVNFYASGKGEDIPAKIIDDGDMYN